MKNSPAPTTVFPGLEEPTFSEFGFDSEQWMERARHAAEPGSLGMLYGYEVLGVCGRGGQGTVYQCRSKSGQIVAIKRLHGGTWASRSARQRLIRELEATAGLDHPSIVAARSVTGVDEPLLEMDWIEGVALNEWARGLPEGPPRPAREILTLFVKICDALAHAHERGMIHRDLKPSNILVNRSGDPFLLDFGIARPAAELSLSATHLTLTEQLVGTPAYASPEQVLGNASELDARSDIYSAGILLYEAFTGASPYPANLSLGRLLLAVEEGEFQRPRALNASVPRNVETVIVKCLHKDPARRYSSARELRADLERCLRGEATEARYSPILSSMGRLRRRHRVAAWIVPPMLLIAMLAGGYGIRRAYLIRDARAFIEQVVPTVVADWNPELLMADAAPGLADEIPEAERERIFGRLREKFGAVRSLLGSEGTIDVPPIPIGGRHVTAIWFVYFDCEKMKCQIEVRLIRHQSRWWIESFMGSAVDQSGTIGGERPEMR